MTNIHTLPRHLQENGLFCVWKYEERDCKRTKVPYNPKTGGKAQPNNPDTFAPMNLAASVQSGYDGIGIGIFGDICAIDIDHCMEESGAISNMAGDIMNTMLSYTEISPSGQGLRILFKAPGLSYDKSRYYINNQKLGLEVYAAGVTQKYVTVTGNAVLPDMEIEERTTELMQVLEKYMKRQPKEAEVSKPQTAPLSLADDELIAKAHHAKGGEVFAALWNGDITGYKSASEADMVLCNKLAFWTGGDAAQMDRLFRVSGLMRSEKWDRVQSGSTYGALTIQKAVSECKGFYNPGEHFKKRVEDDFSASTGEAPPKFINPIESPEAIRRYSLDDIGNARLFADTFRGKLLYIPEYKAWWFYKGGVWQRDVGDVMVRQCAKQLADYVRGVIPPPPASTDEDDKWEAHRKHWYKCRFIATLKSQIQLAQDEISGRANDFDRPPLLFNCKNGTLNLKTMQLQPHNPADMLSKQANIQYDASARCERFERFIYEITEGNADRARMLQKALGYSMKGEANEECYFTAIGEKTRNGKGTLFDTILHLFGSYGAQMDFDTIAKSDAKDGSRATPDIARLIGLRLVLANEPSKGVCLNEALIKQLTGNDDLTGRPLYGDVIQFKPIFKLIITANSKPTVSDDSLFSSGRIKLLPFTRHFSAEERDTSLKSTLREPAALSGILNWLLDGYKLYMQEGLKDTAEMKALTEEYRKENDLIEQFLNDRFDQTARNKTTVKALRADYAQWCEVIGAKPLGLKLFKEELTKREIKITNAQGQMTICGAIKSFTNYTD